MAGELKTTTSFNYTKNGVTESLPPRTVTLDVTGNNFVRKTQDASTSDATLDKGAIGTIGQAYFFNMDSTNHILLGEDGSSYPTKLMPGEDARGRWNGTNVHFKSGAGTPKLFYCLFEN